jgi:hypothetical protein
LHVMVEASGVAAKAGAARMAKATATSESFIVISLFVRRLLRQHNG